MADAINPQELALRKRFKENFEYYAPRALKIKAKSGSLVPFDLNQAQRYLHLVAEKQLLEKGRIRILVLKGRQQGISTYIEGRFYWKTSQRRGVNCFILTHEDKATQNLFAMAQRYHDNCPAKLKPSTKSESAKSLDFAALDSSYAVGTAGTKAVGRSTTNQYFHGSEVAFWPHADTHSTGVLQSVPMDDGTEVFLESTANGIGNYFHSQWQLAERGESDYIAVFLPWYWQPEYTLPVGDDFELTPEEFDLLNQFKSDGLTAEHLNWRRMKTREFISKGDGEDGDWKFKQEYPFTAAEAFQTSGEESLISPKVVLAARKTEKEIARDHPHLVGVDPARFGADRTAIIHRQGRKAWGIDIHRKKSTMQIAGLLARMLRDPVSNERSDIDMMFIDSGGVGGGIYDRLEELGFADEEDCRICAVEAGSSPLDDKRFVKKRDEMWVLMRDWLMLPGGVDIPDLDVLQTDLCTLLFDYDSLSRYVLETSKAMKKRGLASPDIASALAQTFAFPVAPRDLKKMQAMRNIRDVNYGV